MHPVVAGHSKSQKLPVSLGARGFATKLKQSTDTGEKAQTQKRSRYQQSAAAGDTLINYLRTTST